MATSDVTESLPRDVNACSVPLDGPVLVVAAAVSPADPLLVDKLKRSLVDDPVCRPLDCIVASIVVAATCDVIDKSVLGTVVD